MKPKNEVSSANSLNSIIQISKISQSWLPFYFSEAVPPRWVCALPTVLPGGTVGGRALRTDAGFLSGLGLLVGKDCPSYDLEDFFSYRPLSPGLLTAATAARPASPLVARTDGATNGEPVRAGLRFAAGARRRGGRCAWHHKAPPLAVAHADPRACAGLCCEHGGAFGWCTPRT